MRYYQNPTQMFNARGLCSKKKADKEYAMYKQCMIKNYFESARDHYNKAKHHYQISDLEFEKAKKYLFYSWIEFKNIFKEIKIVS